MTDLTPIVDALHGIDVTLFLIMVFLAIIAGTMVGKMMGSK